MNSYDSDESLSDVESGTSTNILLGYASKSPTDDAFSQLGGQPTWLDPKQYPSPLLAQCKTCNKYLTLLLQLNGDLPDRFPGHERRLYIWTCRKKACRRKGGNVRAIRAIRASNTSAAAQRQSPTQKTDTSARESSDVKPWTNIGSSLFGGKPDASSAASYGSAGASMNPFSAPKSNPFSSATSSNPFSTAPAPASSLAAKAPQPPKNPVSDLPATFAAKARISSPPPSSAPPPTPRPAPATLPWPQSSELPNPYPAYHLDADYEYLSDTTPPKNDSQYANMTDIEDDETAGSGSGSGGQEDRDAFESAHDKAFQHFADTIAQNPEQVLRYDFGGSPLLYSRIDAVGQLLAPTHLSSTTNSRITTTSADGSQAAHRMPRCESCSAQRVFEVQLMPHAIAELEAEEDVGTLLKDGMDWGTMILGVCSKDCGQPKEGEVAYFEEWLGVQWEEVVRYDQKR